MFDTYIIQNVRSFVNHKNENSLSYYKEASVYEKPVSGFSSYRHFNLL